MSYEKDNSDYDEDSFDNESIEEISDDDTVSKISDAASEGILQESVNSRGSNYFNDKSSPKDEDSEISNFTSEDDDFEVSEHLHSKEKKPAADKHEHAIDSSLSEDIEDLKLDEKLKSIKVKVDKKPNRETSEPKSTNDLRHNGDNDDSFSYRQSHIEYDITSRTPSSFNSDSHAFHVDIGRRRESPTGNLQRARNAGRKSLSFSNERMREIERHNQILLKKILTQKPRREILSSPNTRTSSSAVNRKKQQRQIDLDNQVLKKKIEAISLRRHSLFQR